MSDAPNIMVEYYRERERRRILGMKPGPEMDEMVVKMMGCEPTPSIFFNDLDKEKKYYCIAGSPGSEEINVIEFVDSEWVQRVFNPSSNIAAAWEVVEKLKQVQITITVMHTLVHCKINAGFDRQVDVTSETAPEAICKAALLVALEGEG